MKVACLEKTVFCFEKNTLGKDADTATYFLAFFLKQKEGPCGKKHTRQKNVLQWSLAAAQWSLATAQWSLATAQWSLAAAQ